MEQNTDFWPSTHIILAHAFGACVNTSVILPNVQTNYARNNNQIER